jgi:hypothetical protein
MKPIFFSIALIGLSLFTGCISTYHVQTFSQDVETLPATLETKIVEGQKVTKRVTQGMFTARSYEEAMVLAKEAGYTRVLSIEYGTTKFWGLIWFIGTKWVTIRCAKDEEVSQNSLPDAREAPSAGFSGD